jgi:hypothetical protein
VTRRTGGRLGPWVVAGNVAWAGLLWLGWSLWHQAPPRAGFDLALLLEGARSVLAGHSPYDPAMLAGTSPDATSLFYSYPPPVAQAMTVLAWLPDGAALLVFGAGATVGLAAAAGVIARVAGHGDPAGIALRALLVAPLVLPFAVALLFGNLDAWYPLAFGLLAAAVLPGASPRGRVAGGVALGLVAVAKLHPASILVWLGARAVAERGGPTLRILGAATASVLAVVAVSVVVGGSGPWSDYVTVVRAGAGAAVIDPRNVGPVSLLGQLVALDAGAARAAQAVVSLAAVVVTALAAIRVREPVASLGVAIAASLVVLPVTWYHYPVALIPVAIVLVLGRPAARGVVALAAVVADVAIGPIVLLWPAVGLLLLAGRRGTRDVMPPPRARSGL